MLSNCRFAFLRSLGYLLYWYDSRVGCEQSRVQFPEQPHASFGFDAGMTWHYPSITLAIANFLPPQCQHYPCGILNSQGAHGVVVSHPPRMRKALGSNPAVSMFSEQCKPGITSWSFRRISLLRHDVLNSALSTKSCLAEAPVV